jgi:hypothetical protein
LSFDIFERISVDVNVVHLSIDPAKINREILRESLTLRNCAWALVFYATAMIVNLVMMQTEDTLRMAQYNRNCTNQTTHEVMQILSNRSIMFIVYLIISFDEKVLPNEREQWKQLTAVRAACIIVGWLIVGIHVKKDRLSIMIKNTEDKAFYDELNIEQTAVQMETSPNALS